MADGSGGRAPKRREAEARRASEAAERAAGEALVYYPVPGSLLTEARCRHCFRPIYLSRGSSWESAGPCSDWNGYGLSHVPSLTAMRPDNNVQGADNRRNRAAMKIQDLRIEHSIASAGLPKGRAPRTKRIGIEVCLRGK